MARIGLLTMSDGRDFVASDADGFCRGAESVLTDALIRARARGDPSTGADHVQRTAHGRLSDQRPDLTIYHYPVWAFTHFTMLGRHGDTRTRSAPRWTSTSG